MLKVLLVEDDVMIADLFEDALIENGYDVCGIARTVKEAVALVQLNRPNLAIIDVRLAEGDFGTDVVAHLHDGPRIGILYATGNINLVIDDADGDACIRKPFHMSDLVTALEILQQIVIGDTAFQPFPLGFHLLRQNDPSLWKQPHA